MLEDIRSYQTDHLFLLVGTNPLPNYVAALLLAKEKGTIHLLHTGGAYGTWKVAERLKKAVKDRQPDITINFYEIDDSDGPQIHKKVIDILKGLDLQENALIGLHYTGGTKAMSVHAYNALDHFKFPRKVLSYLDARTKNLIIESNFDNPKHVNIGDRVKVSLKEILQLHGYEAKPEKKSNFYPDFYVRLAKGFQDKDVLKQWREWLDSLEQFNSLPDPSHYPLLDKNGVVKAFDDICGGSATEEKVAHELGYQNLKSCRKWFNAEWLEEYVFWAVQQIANASKVGIGDHGINLKPKGSRDFEIDVVAVKGYQLFAISCMVSSKKKECKSHLFEIYTRARQIGGDEAWVALVCFYKDHQALQKEIEETWFTEGKLKVFDRTVLTDPDKLKGSLEEWFNEAG